MTGRGSRWAVVAVVGLAAAVAGGLLLAGSRPEEPPGSRKAPAATVPAGFDTRKVTILLRPGADPRLVAGRNGLRTEQVRPRPIPVFDPEGTGTLREAPGAVVVLGEVGQAEVERMVARLGTDPDVLDADAVDRIIFPGAPDDPGWQGEEAIDQWGLRRLRPQQAWDDPAVRRDDPGLVALVIDGRVDAGHPDLDVRPASGSDGPVDSHGTFVAGLVAARTGNGLGIASPAWRQSVTSFDVERCREDCSFLDGVASAVQLAGLQAPDAPVQRVVVNASLCYAPGREGCNLDHVPDATEAQLTRLAFDSGRVLWVSGSGNDGAERVAWPARYPWFLSVGAIEADGSRWAMSNGGPELDLAAPGVDVWSTAPRGRYRGGEGTSYAGPHVTGAAVALWKHEPLLTSQQVMKRLLASGGRGHDNDTGYGVVDVHRAFTLDRTPPTIKVDDRSVDGRVAFRLQVVDDLDRHGLRPINERVEPADAGPEQFRLDFGEVPTSAIAAVRWSVDGGPWHDVPVGAAEPQAYRRPDGSLCQVCEEISVDPAELAATGAHRLVLRAWDSSAKADDAPRFTEVVVPLGATGPGVTAEAGATAVVLDTSGSMKEPMEAGRRLEGARRAADHLLDVLVRTKELGGSPAVSIVAFAGSPVTSGPTDDPEQLRAAIARLAPEFSGTNIWAALRSGIEAVENAAGPRSLVLLSDGETNSGPNGAAILAGPVEDARRAGITIHTVLFGDVGADLMRRIAEATGGHFATATTPADLEEALVTAGHRGSGLLVAQGEGRSVEVGVPRDSGAVQVTMIGADAGEQVVTLVSPSGRAVTGRFPPAERGVPGVVTLAVPAPEPGRWKVEAAVPVRYVASVLPSPSLRADDLAPPPDPGPAAVAGQPAMTAKGPELPVVPGRRQAAVGRGLVALGVLLALVGLLGTRADRRRRRTPGLALAVAEGPDRRRALRVAEGDVIGRARSCRHRLADPAFAPRHGRFARHDGAWFLVSLEPGAPLVVDGDPVELARLVPGGAVEIGTTRLVVEEELDDARAPAG